METDKKNIMYIYLTWGMIIGFTLDILIATLTMPETCTPTPLQEFINIGCLPLGDMYGLFLWFGIIGGIIGYFSSRK